jgi:hypothetical protein
MYLWGFMSLCAIIPFAIVVLIIGAALFMTYWDYKHYNPYTEVVCINNNAFIVDTSLISTLDQIENGEPSIRSGTSTLLYQKLKGELTLAAMKEGPKAVKTYYLATATFHNNKIIVDYTLVDINSLYNR